MARRTGRDEDEERRLFEEAMRGVRPLAPGPARLVGPPPRAPRPKVPQASLPVAQAHAGPPVAALEGRDPSVSIDRLRALRRGEVRPEATLDLHGRSAVEAGAALDAFLRGAQQGGRRCLLVIHGRGQRSGPAGPVLRPLVAARLANCAAVLAYVTAPPALGGQGATLVLVRR